MDRYYVTQHIVVMVLLVLKHFADSLLSLSCGKLRMRIKCVILNGFLT